MNLYLRNLGTSNISLVGDNGIPNVSIPATAGANYTTVAITQALGNTLFCDSVAAMITDGDISANFDDSDGKSLTAANVESFKEGNPFDLDSDNIPDQAENINLISKTEIDNTDSPYTVLATDTLIGCDVSAALLAITLPIGVNGTVYEFKDAEGSANANNITITPNGAETIEGAATYVINTDFSGVRMYYNLADTDWKLMSSPGASAAAVALNTTHRTSDGSDHTFLDQAVTIAGTPTFASLTTNGVGGNVALTPAAQAASAGTGGATIVATGGAGSAAGGAVAGAAGGAASLTSGVGGASDGTDVAGLGGANTVVAGAGGVAHTAVVGGVGGAQSVAAGDGGAGVAAAVGGAGGDLSVNAGAGGVTGGAGAGANGAIAIGDVAATAITLGNATDNTTLEVLGTGDIDLDGGGDILNSRLVQAVVTATGGAAAATAGTLDIQVNDLAGNAITRAVYVRVDSSLTQYGGNLVATGTAFLGAASVGTTTIGTGAIAGLILTDATGHYVAVTSNAADETAWFSATTAPGGHVDAAAGCVVVDCVPNDATWAA